MSWEEEKTSSTPPKDGWRTSAKGTALTPSCGASTTSSTTCRASPLDTPVEPCGSRVRWELTSPRRSRCRTSFRKPPGIAFSIKKRLTMLLIFLFHKHSYLKKQTKVVHGKVQLFWEGHKNLKKSPTCFDASVLPKFCENVSKKNYFPKQIYHWQRNRKILQIWHR